MKELFSPKEVAQILHVHEKTIRRYLREGVLEGQKIGGSWKVNREVLEQYMDTQPKQSMEDHYQHLRQKDRGQICIRADIQVKDADEGHKLAQSFMNLISQHQSCNFQYQMEEERAQYLLCGSMDFLHEALNLLDESGYSYDK